MKNVRLLYGSTGLELALSESTEVLRGSGMIALADAPKAVADALNDPIGSESLAELLRKKKPRSVAITISDITRPVPNRDFLPAIISTVRSTGLSPENIVIIVGTGMHRPSTPEEHRMLVGNDILGEIEVIDHLADDPTTLVEVSSDPPIRICRRFAEADFRIVTGFIEPHFMAGFSGGRKGVCPALVDLPTIQRFHGYSTLASEDAHIGQLEGNPCHEIALAVAQKVGVDFLFNVTVTGEKEIAGVYCGDLVLAHQAGCADVAAATTAEIDGVFDLVITCGGGAPLDQTFYQSVKGMCGALPALDSSSTLMIASHCGEQIGSPSYTNLMRRWGSDWKGFLAEAAANKSDTKLDQWEFQMQCRVLACIGVENLLLATDGIDQADQCHLAVTPIVGQSNVEVRLQRAVDDYLAASANARVAVIPDGPYTMLKRR